MAWEGSTRARRLPGTWRSTIVPRIMSRDSRQCQWPTDTGICAWPATDIDHKIAGDDHRDENLWALCRWHHERKTSAEGAQQRRNNGYARERRAVEKHPGLISDT